MAISAIVGMGKRTVSGMLCAGAEQFDDWTAAYRIFARNRIDRMKLFAPARDAVIERLRKDEPLTVVMDDTIIRKRGRKVHGAGWKRDPLGPHFCNNFIWAQRFLQMSAALPDAECPGRARAVPVDFIHAPSPSKPRKKAPPEVWQEYRVQQQQRKVSKVAVERLRQLREQVKERKIICSVDGGFTNQTFFRDIPQNTVLVGRIRKDARLYAPPEVPAKPSRGRQRWYGQALPTPEEVRKDGSIPWKKVKAYASGKWHDFEVKHLPAVRWKGTGNRTVQVIAIRALSYRPRKSSRLLYRNPAYLLCTDAKESLERILQSYLWRWEIELNFRDEKTVMGAGQAQVRTAESVDSVPQLIVASYAYLLLAGNAVNAKALPRPKWQKPRPEERTTTQMMQNVFRSQLWKIAIDANKTHFVKTPHPTQTQFYSDNSLKYAVCYAYK
ncbi:MAG: transposase [Planctomycetes bacterium]|nr:transposase [Planctomycetota bacterium]